MGKYGESVAWRGRLWCFTKTGYFRNSKAGGLLHRVLYETHIGPIPPGADVHHDDEDPSHNRLSNLRILTRKEHAVEHEPRGFAAFASDRYSKRCMECGDAYETAWPDRALYCSGACKQTGHRKHVLADPARAVKWKQRQRDYDKKRRPGLS